MMKRAAISIFFFFFRQNGVVFIVLALETLLKKCHYQSRTRAQRMTKQILTNETHEYFSPQLIQQFAAHFRVHAAPPTLFDSEQPHAPALVLPVLPHGLDTFLEQGVIATQAQIGS